MGKGTQNLHKSQTKLFGKPLIEWQIRALNKAGVKKIALVTGYLSDSFDLKLSYFHNKNWSKTNMVSSLLVAEPWLLKGDNLIAYSDIIYSHIDVKKLKGVGGDIVVAFDPNWLKLWSIRFENPVISLLAFVLIP